MTWELVVGEKSYRRMSDCLRKIYNIGKLRWPRRDTPQVITAYVLIYLYHIFWVQLLNRI